MKSTLAETLILTAVLLTARTTEAVAQSLAYPAPIASFDLVAPGIGWAASSTNLYWTVSNGRRWRDITPPRASQDEPIQLVHFNDRLHGWALLINAVENQPATLEIEKTRDGGASWNLFTVDLSHPPIDPTVPPTIDSMSFSDPAHGWILISTSSAGVHSGILVVSADAGRNWRVLRSLPVDGNISFSSPANGVLTVSSPNRDAPVWHTADGGRSWAPADLPVPAKCLPCIPTRVDSAHFFSTNHAVLTALLKTPGDDDLSSVAYRTENGGATWRVAEPSALHSTNANARLTTVSDGYIIVISAASHNSLVLKIKGRTAIVPLPHSLTPGAIDRLSISSNRTAWALFTSPQTNLVSIDPHKKLVKVITPRPSRIEHPSTPRHQNGPRALLIHCTLVSARPSAQVQAVSNDIIRANAMLRTK